MLDMTAATRRYPLLLPWLLDSCHPRRCVRMVGLHGADQSLICVRLPTLLLRAAQARAIVHSVSFAATAGFELPTMGP